MKKLFNVFNKIEKTKGKYYLLFFLFFIDNTYILLVSFLVTKIDPTIVEVFESYSLTEIFILSILLAPLFETFLCQFLIIEILLLYKKIRIEIIVLISTLVFSLGHYYNFIYILLIVFPGFLYAYYYIYLKKSKTINPFFGVYILHLFSNLLAFILDDILG